MDVCVPLRFLGNACDCVRFLTSVINLSECAFVLACLQYCTEEGTKRRGFQVFNTS